MSITIITPVYNGAAHIRSTMESLSKQTVPFEHIVMDSRSSDGTADIAREFEGRFNTRVISEKDEGHFDAVSKGFALGKGDILGWINAGDFYLPWTLRVVQAVFDKYPEVEWITGMPAVYFEEKQMMALWLAFPVYIQGLIRRGYHNGKHLPPIEQETTFWRRSLWDRAGGSELLIGQGKGKGYATDYHLWKKFAEHAPLRTVRSLFSGFSVCPGQITERLRGVYFKECGVDRPYDKPLWLYSYPWLLYSFLRVQKTINVQHL